MPARQTSHHEGPGHSQPQPRCGLSGPARHRPGIMGWPGRRLAGAAFSIALATVMVNGCGSPAPTTAGFCKVYHQQENEYLRQYGTPAGNGLGDLVQMVGAISDWVPIFEKLDQAAPPSIEPDVKNILDSLKQQEQAAGQEASDPLGALSAGLLAGLMASASWENLSNFVSQHCEGN
jgi:hypothetical protein